MPFLSALGNAPIDLIAPVPDGFLQRFDLVKGDYNKVDDNLAAIITAQLPPDITTMPGGGVSNAVACYATLGGQAAFMGPLVMDAWGQVIADDLQARGIDQPIAGIAPGPHSTKRILCLITPDGERSFVGLPGGGAVLTNDNLCGNTLGRSDFILLDGYILRKPETLAAFQTACNTTHGQIGLMPGSVTMLRDYRVYFEMLLDTVDALFINATEARFLYQTDDMPRIYTALQDRYARGSVTLGADGAFVFADGKGMHIPNAPLSGPVIDTNGAGDAFAGGLLYGLLHGHDLSHAGQIGATCAAHVITRPGARLPRDFVLPDGMQL